MNKLKAIQSKAKAKVVRERKENNTSETTHTHK